ncbi:DEAD-box ATP-dependent RNA helicase 40-like protein [Trifolium pratense]|uniref:DEAD-box ATP-dependent RNA helicase 40-like protein n=1 Tax=Trifolium pratense TaxID=57577 RepID=A0A2K3N2R1_TRIPR|nr:DEAD-box ATP-dependent RNA helicase 40-like protein [Trifolium pratense]
MATTEAASAGVGPRYAPDDPSLPAPWKGLIDGATGLLYYWNPDTNVTQYEKPTPLAPPVPAASTPSLAPIPVTQQHGQGQQMMQQQQGGHYAQQHGQQMPQQMSPHVAQGTQQPNSQAAQPVQQQNSQISQPAQQPGLHQGRPQMMQPQGQQMMQYQGQQFQQMHQMPPQPIHPQQFGQGGTQDHGSHLVQPQAPQFTPQNMHYMGYQQNMVTPRQPNSQQIQPNMHSSGQPNPQPNQHPHNIHNQHFENQQDFKTAMPKMEEAEFKNGSQVGFSPSQYQQRSALPVQNNKNVPAEVSSGQVTNASVNPAQPQQFRGYPGSMQQPSPTIQSQQGGSDLYYQQGPNPNFQNQMSPGIMHGHPSNVHPVAQKMVHEDNVHGRAGNDYYYNSNKEMPPMGRQQPDMTQMPISRNPQDMRIGNSPFQNNVPIGNGSGITVNAMSNMFTPPIGGPSPLSSNSFTRPPYGGSSDVTDLSAAELYCQQHEVTATNYDAPKERMEHQCL